MYSSFRLQVPAIVLLVLAGVSSYGETRKAGLWEIRVNTTWQHAPYQMSAKEDPSNQGPRTHDVCLTQEMIDKYGALLPQSRGQCKIQDKVMIPGGSTAKYVCTGRMAGEGQLNTTWSDDEHSTGRLHFVGTMQNGDENVSIEWTTVSSATFKSSDCGNVKPLEPTPAK